MTVAPSWIGRSADRAFSSCSLRGDGSKELSEEAKNVAPEIVHALVERDVQVEVAPIHAAEGAKVVPEPEPEAFDAVGMDLTHPVTVVVPPARCASTPSEITRRMLRAGPWRVPRLRPRQT